jgi:hypothetical protein
MEKNRVQKSHATVHLNTFSYKPWVVLITKNQFFHRIKVWMFYKQLKQNKIPFCRANFFPQYNYFPWYNMQKVKMRNLFIYRPQSSSLMENRGPKSCDPANLQPVDWIALHMQHWLQETTLSTYQTAESLHFPRYNTRKVYTFSVSHVENELKFANISENSPKIGKFYFHSSSES